MILRPSILLACLMLAISQNACRTPSSPAPAEHHKPTHPPRGNRTSIQIDEVFQCQQAGTAYLIDARPCYFYQLGHLPGAIHLSAEDSEPRIAALKPELDAAVASAKRLIVYCHGFGCSDAGIVAKHLTRHGYDVAVFGGGWKHWKKAELPVESPSHPPIKSATSPAP